MSNVLSVDETSIELEEEKQLEALARSLELAEGFALLPAQCDSPEIRRRLMNRLRIRLPRFRIEEIHFAEPVTHLLDELAIRMDDPRRDVVCVSGLENTISDPLTLRSNALIANLNASRNSFSVRLGCPLVLWVPEHVFVSIARGAPDFFSVRSGSYFFGHHKEPFSFDPVLLIDEPDFWPLHNLTDDEKNERAQARENILSSYGELPAEKRDFVAEARLHREVGVLYKLLRLYDKAESHYESIQKLGADFRRRDMEAISEFELGLLEIQRSQDALARSQHLQRAEEMLTLSVALWCELEGESTESRLQESYRKNEAAAVRALGICYSEQENFGKALEMLEKAEQISRQAGDRVAEGRALLVEGHALGMEGALAEAESKTMQSLDLFRAAGDRTNEAIARSQLSRVLGARGEGQKAEELRRASRDLARELGFIPLLLDTLEHLGSFYVHRGRHLEAESCYQEYLDISRKYGKTYPEADALKQLSSLYESMGDYQRALQFARESALAYEHTNSTFDVKAVQADIERLERTLAERGTLRS